MLKDGKGSIRLFRVFGINVWLHWSWFLGLAYALDFEKKIYDSPVWIIVECIAVFGIVLLHEFGHALACKQTGGQADTIVLWPLGGIAFVRPPNRPGPILWSLAAGPLVNILLIPVTFGALIFAGTLGIFNGNLDLQTFMERLVKINFLILCFNMLPIYPLDGGQILRSLLWFVIGPVRSLYASVPIGFAGAAAMVGLAYKWHNPWLIFLALFAGSRCWTGFREAKRLGKIQAMPRHTEFKCPACGEAPIAGEFWTCRHCLKPFDLFATGAHCPQCNQEFLTTKCPSCQQPNPVAAWRIGPPPL